MKNGEEYRVLVVDDDHFVRDLVSMVLRNLGFETIEAADGLEAYDLVQEKQPALIISDVLMPRADGISLCRRLRKDGNTTPFFFLTNADAAQSLRASRSRISGWLPKPMNPERLIPQLKRIISHVFDDQPLPEDQ